MLSFLRRQRVKPEGIEAEAEALIRELGVEAYSAARQREREASSDALAKYWSRVALAIADKTGKRIGLDTSTRMAMNVVFAPDREPAAAHGPQPRSELSQVEQLERILAAELQPFRVQFVGAAPERGPATLKEVEIQVAGVSSAIIAAAKLEWPPRTIGLRILDREGREVFSRQKTNRR